MSVPCLCMEVHPYNYFWWCGYLKSLGVICYDRWVLSVAHKNYFKDWCLMTSQLTFLFLTYLNLMNYSLLSKACKTDNFESHNPLKISFTSIQGLHSNFVDCESFLESISTDILALCKTNLDDSIDSGNFNERCYLPLIWKDSITHMYGLAINVNEGLPFALALFLKNSADSELCFQLALLHSVFYFIFLYWSPSLSLCTDSTSSNIDKVLSINPSVNVFVFGDFHIHHKVWLTDSAGTDRSGKLCYNFSISNDLTHTVNFPTQIPDCESRSPALFDLFISWC